MRPIGGDLRSEFGCIRSHDAPVDETKVPEKKWCRAHAAVGVDEMVQELLRDMLHPRDARDDDRELDGLIAELLGCIARKERRDFRLLGEYQHPGKGNIVIYGHPLTSEEREIVRIHERWHAVHHRLPDPVNGRIWTGFPSLASAWKELLAQLFTWLSVRDTDPILSPAFTTMSAKQPLIYRTWEAFRDYDPEQAQDLYWRFRNGKGIGPLDRVGGGLAPYPGTDPDERPPEELRVWWLPLARTRSSFAELVHRRLVAQEWADIEGLGEVLDVVHGPGGRRAVQEKLESLVGSDVWERIRLDGTVDAVLGFLDMKAGDMVIALSGKRVAGVCMLEYDATDSYEYRHGHVYAHTTGYPVTWYKWDQDKHGPAPQPPEKVKGLTEAQCDRAMVFAAWRRAGGQVLGERLDVGTHVSDPSGIPPKFPWWHAHAAVDVARELDLVVREIEELVEP